MESDMIDRNFVTQRIINAKRSLGLSWTDIAGRLGVKNVALCTAGLLGQMPFSSEKAVEVARLFGLTNQEMAIIQEVPCRGVIIDLIPKDPTLYRFYELLQVYGTTLKELIHEEFGDGIMSAIDCHIKIDRVSDLKGDRIKITIDGKHLKYPDM
jgi:cyanate hydratase